MLTELFTGWLGRPTLVAEDDTWALLALMCVTVALAVWLEQRYAWASKVSGALIALLVALAASNLAIIPNSCVLYDDIVWNFAVPMGIPLLLLQCNMKKIWRETGRMMVIFLIGSAGNTFGGAWTRCGRFPLGQKCPAAARVGIYPFTSADDRGRAISLSGQAGIRPRGLRAMRRKIRPAVSAAVFRSGTAVFSPMK